MAPQVRANHAACSLALCTFLVACAGTSPRNAHGTGGAGGLTIPGSYNLVVDEVTATPLSTGGPPAPEVTSPSEGQAMRLDVRKSASGSIEGVLTPRWGTPAAVDGNASAGKYRLTGGVLVSGFDSNANTTDHWDALEIPVSGEALGTAVAMQGFETVIQGDVLWTFELIGAATLLKDVTPPEIRSKPASPRGPTEMLLPWDPIEVDSAEPVVAATVEAKASVLLSDVDHAGALTPLPIAWSFGPIAERTSWAGIVHAAAHLSGWDHHPTQTAKPYTLQALAGITDGVGLESQELSTSFAVLDVGAPQGSFTFDVAGSPVPVTWGVVAFRESAASEAVRCETGGCAEIGPFNTISCGTGRHGIAGRVEAPTGTLAVRYRLIFGSGTSAPHQPPYPYGPAFTIEIAKAGGEATVEQIDSPSRSLLLDLGAPTGELRWATAWTTAFVALPGPIPPTVVDLGFSIGSAGAGFEWCGGGPMPAPVKTLLVIDSVSGQ